MSKIRWGVLSTANIGIEKVIPAMQQSELCEIVAIASSRIEMELSRISGYFNISLRPGYRVNL
jgi:predicted dehydrogenase